MMGRYLDLQRQQLSGLGEARQALQDQLARERQRVQQLREALAQMGQALDLRQGLVRENYYQMQQSLRRLLAQQQDKVVAVEQQLAAQEQQWRALLGKVKGLELLLRQQAEQAAAQAARREQRLLDEFNTVRWCRGD